MTARRQTSLIIVVFKSFWTFYRPSLSILLLQNYNWISNKDSYLNFLIVYFVVAVLLVYIPKYW